VAQRRALSRITWPAIESWRRTWATSLA